MAEPSVSISVMSVGAVIPILMAGWGSSIVFFLIGVVQRRTVLVGYGILLSGIMTLVTSTLVFLRLLPEVSGGYRATAGDVLMIGFLGFLGGALAMLGASYATIATRKPYAPRSSEGEISTYPAGKR